MHRVAPVSLQLFDQPGNHEVASRCALSPRDEALALAEYYGVGKLGAALSETWKRTP